LGHGLLPQIGEAAADAEGVKTMGNLGLNIAHLLGLLGRTA